MERWTPDADGLKRAADALRAGRLVGLPTETVYGLAGNARDPLAVASIFEAKRRPTFDPLIVHAANIADALSLSADAPPTARRLAEAFWPGPLTLVLPRRADLPDLLSAGLDTLALRVPAHPVARALIRECGCPLAAPSANRFGRISPTRADHVVEELGDVELVAGVIDAGPCEKGVESTVVGFASNGRVEVYRLGATPLEVIRDLVDDVVVATSPVESPRHAERAPGMLKSHYAPRTPMTLLDAGASPSEAGGATGWLTFERILDVEGPQELLSANGDLAEAAGRLFACLRRLDAAGVDRIVAWKVPEEGLGRAINDRLARAAE